MNPTPSTSRDASSDTAGAVAGAVGAGIELVDELAPDVVDVVESAAETVVSTGRLAIRIITKTLRFVARHPKGVLIGVAVVAVAAGACYLRRDVDDRS